MQRSLLLITFIFLLGCGTRPSDPILVPEEIDTSYDRVLSLLIEDFKKDETNELNLRQQLYYCDKLNWPSECGYPLKEAKVRWGLTPKLIRDYAQFYQRHNRQKEILILLASVPEDRYLTEVKLQALDVLEQYDELPAEVTNYLNLYTDSLALARAADLLMNAGAFQQASEVFDRLRKTSPTHPMLLRYYPMLIDQGDYEKADSVLTPLWSDKADHYLKRSFGLVRYETGRIKQGKGILRRLSQSDSACYLLSEYYQREANFDSALYFSKQVLRRNREDSKALLHTADLYQKRGWLSASLPYFEHALEVDSTNTSLARKVSEVRRKVAYLRLLKEQQKKVPILELKKKTTIDE